MPDLYQGNELMDDSLVDPDNRRPVDYALRAAMLDELERVAAGDADAPSRALRGWALAPDTGHAKLWLTWRLLSLRSDRPQLFQQGDYTALDVRGRAVDGARQFGMRLGGLGGDDNVGAVSGGPHRDRVTDTAGCSGDKDRTGAQ